MKRAMKSFSLFLFFILTGIISVSAKTEKFGTWLEFEISKELTKKLEISFIPEIRFQDDFTVDEYLFDAKLSYQVFKFLNVAAAYRINTNIKNKGNEVSKKFVFDVNGEREFGRFDASLRARFTNYSDVDEGVDEANFFRPRLKIEYDIKGNKIKPYTSYELFRNTTIKEFSKSRLDFGFTRKMGDFHRVGIYYRLQSYTSDRTSINILGIDYRFKF